jgi:hypothetical protein
LGGGKPAEATAHNHNGRPVRISSCEDWHLAKVRTPRALVK